MNNLNQAIKSIRSVYARGFQGETLNASQRKQALAIIACNHRDTFAEALKIVKSERRNSKPTNAR